MHQIDPTDRCAGRLVVLGMMAVGVVLIPVRASQLYSRIAARRTVVGSPPSSRHPFVLLSGRLSEVRGFNDFLQDFLVQVRAVECKRISHSG